MFEYFGNFLKKMVKSENKELGSKDDAKERLHLVLMQDRANVSADFLELMKQEIIDVIKKYIVVDETAIDVRLTNKTNDDGTTGAPALYANIPIVNIKNDMKAEKINEIKEVEKRRLENEKNSAKENDVSNVNVEEIIVDEQENKKETQENIEAENKNDDENDASKENKVEENTQEINEEKKGEKKANEDIIEKTPEEKKNVVNNNSKTNKKNKNSSKNNSKKPDVTTSEEDDDGKDVTFDELLKAAEEDLKNSEEPKKSE